MIFFRKKKKKREFISGGQSPEVNKNGTRMENIYALIKRILSVVFFVIGGIIYNKDLHDEGNLIEFSIGDITCKYVATLVGAVIMVVTIWAFLCIKSKVNIR